MQFADFDTPSYGRVIINLGHARSVEDWAPGLSLVRSHIWYNGGDKENVVIGEPCEVRQRLGLS